MDLLPNTLRQRKRKGGEHICERLCYTGQKSQVLLNVNVNMEQKEFHEFNVINVLLKTSQDFFFFFFFSLFFHYWKVMKFHLF